MTGLELRPLPNIKSLAATTIRQEVVDLEGSALVCSYLDGIFLLATSWLIASAVPDILPAFSKV
jgi:hypothetical protein